MAADRGKAFPAFELQPGEEELSYANELLRPASGDRRPGPVTDSADSARSSRNKGRSCSHGDAYVPGSAEYGSIRTEIQTPFTAEDEKTLDELGI